VENRLIVSIKFAKRGHSYHTVRFFKNGYTFQFAQSARYLARRQAFRLRISSITAMAVATDFHRTFLFNVPTRHNRLARYSFVIL
jgi:hypothetical protein